MKGITMQYPKMRFALVIMMFVVILGSLPVAASKGVGIIVEGNPVGTNSIGSLNPLLCDNPYCRRITDFLFPTLYAVDPQTGLLMEAAAGNFGLALDVTAPTSNLKIIKLRDDLVWSDGTSVTAYDVFYSYLAINSRFINTPYAGVSQFINAARVRDEHTIEFAFTQVNCSVTAQFNFPIIPAHIFDSQFRDTVDEISSSDDLETGFKAWLKVYQPFRFDVLNRHTFNNAPTVTAGVFRFAERLPGEEIRLQTADGVLAFIYRDVPSGMDETQFFRSGGSNLLLNPPLEMRDDLIADPDVKVKQIAGNTWNFIAMNVADPHMPRSAADGNGKLLEQGHHPILGDVRVRQAIQKGIDVNALINTALLSYGFPVVSSRMTGSWVFNSNLQPAPYDPAAAKQLLSAAGWLDHNADGIRECDGCLYANQGAPLYFTMLVAGGGGREVAANLISSQLHQLGIQLDINVTDESSLQDQVRFQQFDAYMDGQSQDFPTNADQTDMFTRNGDVLYSGNNFGSYTNPDIEKLMNQGLTLSACDNNARAEIYQKIQAVLQQDQPYIWLYASQDMLVTRGIVGAEPYPNRPFWNIQDWIVAS